MTEDKFQYIVEDFADIRILRYRLENFEKLTLKQKTLAYYLAKAALAGRDITFDQFGKWNILIRKPSKLSICTTKATETQTTSDNLKLISKECGSLTVYIIITVAKSLHQTSQNNSSQTL